MAKQRKDEAVHLAMRPQGLAGRAFGVAMEAINTPAYAFALELLAVGERDDVLEIGFGTGRMIELLLAATRGRVFGVDPTPTMVEVARAKPGVARAAARAVLRLGGDRDLDWLGQPVDRVVANHSFQFWPDPAATVRRLHDLLRPDGRIVLVLRDHTTATPDWLPNPLSKQTDEALTAVQLFEQNGFRAQLVHRGRMVGLVADKPTPRSSD